MSGALIGFAGAVGALGGVGINLALRQSYLSSQLCDLGVLDLPGVLCGCLRGDLGRCTCGGRCRPPSPVQNRSRTWPGRDLLVSGRSGSATTELPCSHQATRLGNGEVTASETRPAYTEHMSAPDWAPLTGFRVAVTSARRADELSALLRRRGATVTSARRRSRWCRCPTTTNCASTPRR